MRLTVSALALTLAAAPGWAAVTADQVWEQIVALNARWGAVVEAQVTRDGSMVTLSGIQGVWQVPFDYGSVTLTMGDIALTEQADGSVVATMPSESQIKVILDWRDGTDSGQVIASADLVVSGYQSVITGDPGDMTITTTADSYDAAFADLTETGSTAFGDVDLPTVFVAIEGLNNTTRISGTDILTVTADSGIARVVTDFGFQADGLTSKSVNEILDTASQTTLVLPQDGVDLLNLAGALRDGLSMAVTATSGLNRSQTVAMLDGEVIQDQSQSAAAGTQTLTIDQTGIQMSVAVSDAQMAMQMMGLPQPINLQLSEMTFGVGFPLLATGTAQDASFSMGMRGLDSAAIMDLIFGGMSADFGGPMDLSLQVDAQVTPRQDLIDMIPLVETLDEGGVAIEFNSLSVPVAQVSWEGAELSGSGQMVIDWTGVTRMSNIPDPSSASAEYRLKGVTALVDRMVAAGLIPQEQVFMVMGGLNMFALPVGDDELAGEVELGADGQLLVNGAPMPF